MCDKCNWVIPVIALIVNIILLYKIYVQVKFEEKYIIVKLN